MALSSIKSVQNCNLKSAHINVKNAQIAAYEPGSLLISYPGSELYHDGYLRSSTIFPWKLANKVVDVEHIRREVYVRGRVVCVSEAVRVETSRVRFCSLVNSCAKKCLCQDPFGEMIPNTPIKRYSNFNVFLPTQSHQFYFIFVSKFVYLTMTNVVLFETATRKYILFILIIWYHLNRRIILHKFSWAPLICPSLSDTIELDAVQRVVVRAHFNWVMYLHCTSATNTSHSLEYRFFRRICIGSTVC